LSKYTADQVEAAIEGSADFDSWYDAEMWRPANTRTNWRGEPIEHDDERLVIDIDGTQYVEFVDGKMPAEGGGEDIWLVVEVGGQFFEKTGYYLSHDGSYWDGEFTEVHPVEKIVTVYEAV
jgi:hypothetical protein